MSNSNPTNLKSILSNTPVAYKPLDTPPVSPTGDPNFQTSLSKSDFGSIQIFSLLDKLLVETVGILQSVTAHQADRLQIYASWQNWYTTQLGKIPTFTVQADKPHGTIFYSGPYEAGARSQANTWNASTTQTLQGYRSAVEADSKQMQSNVDQSNNAVQQAGNMFTAIQQQLSTIMSSLFR